jgi:alpha-D-ribose 1-methylphosphonate 5-phosphate C-P lyase
VFENNTIITESLATSGLIGKTFKFDVNANLDVEMDHEFIVIFRNNKFQASPSLNAILSVLSTLPILDVHFENN